MCTVIGVLGTIFLVKLAFRAMHFRAHGACHGGFGPRMWRRHMRWHHRGRFGAPPWERGPMDLGDLADAHDYDDAGARATAFIDVPQRIDVAFRGLELNARQASEAGDVISILRAAIGPERFVSASEVLLALRAAGKTPFDVDLAEAALGPRLVGAAGREARDALEHLHNILTEEQRTTLLKLLPRT